MALSNQHFAGRAPALSQHNVTVSKHGQYHSQVLVNGDTKRVLCCGLACSEIFSGPLLGRCLMSGHEYEQQAIENLLEGENAQTLSVHTSAGVPAAMSTFLEALSKHLPWSYSDWFCSLQSEGASAVLAAVDLSFQLRTEKEAKRWKVGVASTSYHGPPSTALGSKTTLFSKSEVQMMYPCPSPFDSPEEMELKFSEYVKWLDNHCSDLASILIEPQWGSSQCAFVFPPALLEKYMVEAKKRNLIVICDEIMCGMGRHGAAKTLFLTKALHLQRHVDIITFGKSIATGAFPLSGCVVKNGGGDFNTRGKTVMQSHTYSGSCVRSLMAAVEVLNILDAYFRNDDAVPNFDINSKGKLMHQLLEGIAKKSNGLFVVNGQGLMWGMMLNKDTCAKGNLDVSEVMESLKEECNKQDVLPYFVPVGGIMVTPLFDVDKGVLKDIGTKLALAIESVVKKSL
ncbi:hypothetical protein TrST_g14309 [Triparma strigata]|uniref:Adenosylmethionine-8-amino-7-oxononanoate aminotransferase n=1 Tax=Triparma strigata TaxID=1606541 RepID=A0A9W6ZY98_9STRA|nr:hypothetical protein TrST_g14309 [Triparma strigata]